MNVSRFVSLVSKPILSTLSPRVAPVLWAPCRTITTGRDLVRCGNVGGKPKARPLDVLLGKWVYDAFNPEGDPDKTEVMMTGCEDISKMFVRFARNNGKWNFDTGIEGLGSNNSYTFELGKSFLGQFHDSSFYKIKVEKQNDNALKFSFRKVPIGRVTFTIITEAKGEKLFFETTYADGKKTKKIYTRQ